MNIIIKHNGDNYVLEWNFKDKCYATEHTTRNEALQQVEHNNKHRDIFIEKKKILDGMIERHGEGDYVNTMSNAIHKMLDPKYRNREASFRCATANSMSGYEKYKVEPITNKITEI